MPFGRQHRMRDLDDLRAVGLRVIDAAVVAVARAGLAEIGEVEAAAGVEHDVVRARAA